MAKKTWAQKMGDGREPVVEVANKDFAGVHVGEKMLIATPMIVDAYIRNIPEGVHTSLQQMRADLAAEYNADTTCPLTSGIFLRIVAEHAYEEYQQGKGLNKITPFWRMIDSKTPTAKKLTFGFDFVKEMRKKEGLEG